MKPLPKQAILVVNAMSRKGADVFDEARAKLELAGVELIEAHAVTDPEKMDQVVIDAIARAPMVIVGGGDGLLAAVALADEQGPDEVGAVQPMFGEHVAHPQGGTGAAHAHSGKGRLGHFSSLPARDAERMRPRSVGAA